VDSVRCHSSRADHPLVRVEFARHQCGQNAASNWPRPRRLGIRHASPHTPLLRAAISRTFKGLLITSHAECESGPPHRLCATTRASLPTSNRNHTIRGGVHAASAHAARVSLRQPEPEPPRDVVGAISAPDLWEFRRALDVVGEFGRLPARVTGDWPALWSALSPDQRPALALSASRSSRPARAAWRSPLSAWSAATAGAAPPRPCPRGGPRGPPARRP